MEPDARIAALEATVHQHLESLEKLETLAGRMSAHIDRLEARLGPPDHDPETGEIKEPKKRGDPRVQETMAALEAERGYASGCYAQEAKAVKQMLGQHYEPAIIVDCYKALKRTEFWEAIPLTMTSVAKRIGEWLNQEVAQLASSGPAVGHRSQRGCTDAWPQLPHRGAVTVTQATRGE